MPSSKARKEVEASFLHRLSDKANSVTEALLFATMILMVTVTTLQVVFRFFFNALTWSEELSCFLLVLASLLGASVAFKKGNHIAVTFLLDKLSGAGKKLMQTLIGLLGFGFFAIVAYYGVVLMRAESGQLTPAMGLSMRWIYLMYPITGGLVMLHIADSIAAVWKRS